MAEPQFVFFDFDDTLSDFEALAAQYVAAVARLLTAEFGGKPDAWEAALAPEIAAGLVRYAERFVGHPLNGYADWIRAERARIAAAVFRAAGRALPDGTDAAEVAARLQFDALTDCCAAFPGAGEALGALYKAGARIQMASSQESEYLMAAMMGAGLESYTESKFGPDLVDCAKEGTEFYRRIFSACGIEPVQAIVVDDQPMCLRWAEEVGARVVQACVKPGSPAADFPTFVRALSELPAVVANLRGR